MRRAPATLVILLATACAPAEADRDSYLRDALVDDNRDLLLRDPLQAAHKLARMATDPFQFLRGAVGVYARDATTAGGPAALPTAFGAGRASSCLLVGDPHPENVGAYVTQAGAPVVDFNDFDAARHGPLVLDIRRLALGFAVGLHDVDPALARRAALAVADGYARGARGDVAPSGPMPQPLQRLLEKSMEGRGSTETLDALTAVDDEGKRRFRVQPAAPEREDVEAQLALTVEEHAALGLAVRGWLLEHPGAVVVDMARAVGRGVGSRAHFRYFVLLDDDRVIELKEARDPFVIEGFAGAPEHIHDDNARRIALAESIMQSVARLDPALGATEAPPLSFVVHSETDTQTTLRVGKIVEHLRDGKATPDDVEGTALRAGFMLASAHARGTGPDGESCEPAVRAAFAAPDAPALLVDEIGALLDAYLTTALQDSSRLAALIDLHGPHLGFTP